MKIFLICPVRNATPEETTAIQQYVADMEIRGHRVYWPARDTDQVDPVGLRICGDNRAAIQDAEAIHIWWNTGSTGSLFDLGMAFMAKKPIVLVNGVEPTVGKSFNNFLLAVQSTDVLNDVLAQRRHLSGRAGNCHIYDPQPPEATKWLNEFLNPHNMALTQVPNSWAKIVQLDESKPLPENWEMVCEKAWRNIPERCYES
ncbi:MAG: hypothetical protein LAO08_06510 [Acidobacteriia bacterium]|nr:hypothetical protein [Terriglobia bacterium]